MIDRAIRSRAILAALTIGVTACQEPTTSQPQHHVLAGTLALVAPASGAAFKQNDATIGCPAHATRGYGFAMLFDWSDVPGATKYKVFLKHTGSQYAAVDYAVNESIFAATWCNAFVIDANLTNWTWRVAAFAVDSNGALSDTLWSEERTYKFDPCRLADTTPCYAGSAGLRQQ
jgi:hypothetical protein